MVHYDAALLAALLILLLAPARRADASFVGVPQAQQVAGQQQQQRNTTTTSTRLHAVGQAMRRVRDSITNQERSREDLKLGIAGFYDRSSKLWEDVWGERTSIGSSVCLPYLVLSFVLFRE